MILNITGVYTVFLRHFYVTFLIVFNGGVFIKATFII